MTTGCKRVHDLTPDDLTNFPVWEFALDLEGVDEMLVRPVNLLPVTNLGNRIVGSKIRLANGTTRWAAIQNIDPNSPMRTRHLLSLSLYSNGHWIHLDRYHGYNLEQYGPASLARALGLSVDDVFPISYDVGNCCVGDPLALTGLVEADPKDKLSRNEIFQLIVGKKRGA